MFTRTLGQHALAAALALSVALAAGWGAWHWLALRTPCAEAATGVYIHNLGNTLEDQTRNLSRLSQALRTGDRLVVLPSELTSTDLRFVPYRFLADELRMPVMAYGHSGFQSLGMQLVLAALADDLSSASRVVIMVSPGWFDGDGGLAR
ncbi:D-alanyl-lipoteichoic acid biosynthesis protein DltD [Achromobacter insuavis]